MSEEQLRLMAAMLNDIIDKHIPFFTPYHVFGADVGRCACGAIGQVKYPHVFYEHKDTCLITLNEKLQESLKQKEQVPLTEGQKHYIKLFQDGQCTDGYLMTKLGIFEWKDAQVMIGQYEKEGKDE
jgi:hypothetical protein